MLEHCTIVGITGKKRAGKGSIAKYLQEEYGFMEYAFADPIYDGLQAMFGINFRTPYWQDDKDRIVAGTGKSLRQLLQTLGTEWGQRMVSTGVWVYRLEMRVREYAAITAVQHWLPKIVISDVREPHEVAWLEQYGPLLKVRNKRTEVEDKHTTENGIPDERVQFHIANEYDLPHLYAQVDAVADILGIRGEHA